MGSKVPVRRSTPCASLRGYFKLPQRLELCLLAYETSVRPETLWKRARGLHPAHQWDSTGHNGRLRAGALKLHVRLELTLRHYKCRFVPGLMEREAKRFG